MSISTDTAFAVLHLDMSMKAARRFVIDIGSWRARSQLVTQSCRICQDYPEDASEIEPCYFFDQFQKHLLTVHRGVQQTHYYYAWVRPMIARSDSGSNEERSSSSSTDESGHDEAGPMIESVFGADKLAATRPIGGGVDQAILEGENQVSSDHEKNCGCGLPGDQRHPAGEAAPEAEGFQVSESEPGGDEDQRHHDCDYRCLL
jgi:hypothetical protein